MKNRKPIPQDRTILVTGGTGGLGTAVVLELLSAGYRTIVPYIAEAEARALRDLAEPDFRSELHLLKGDALSATGVAEIYSVIDDSPRPLYGLIHLLGGIRPLRRVSATADEDWDFLVNLNLRSFFIFAREAMSRFERTGNGRIVSIGAMAALKPSANQCAYAAAKAGLVALTRVLADEGREVGVTANCITPSVIDTPANREWGSEEEIGRWVTPAEIAREIVFLCSDEARSINGSIIRMFGRLNLP